MLVPRSQARCATHFTECGDALRNRAISTLLAVSPEDIQAGRWCAPYPTVNEQAKLFMMNNL